MLQGMRCPQGGVTWSVVFEPSLRAGLGHHRIAAANAPSSEDHTGERKKLSQSLMACRGKTLR